MDTPCEKTQIVLNTNIPETTFGELFKTIYLCCKKKKPKYSQASP